MLTPALLAGTVIAGEVVTSIRVTGWAALVPDMLFTLTPLLLVCQAARRHVDDGLLPYLGAIATAGVVGYVAGAAGIYLGATSAFAFWWLSHEQHTLTVSADWLSLADFTAGRIRRHLEHPRSASSGRSSP